MDNREFDILEIVKYIRSSKVTKLIPIVVLSGQVDFKLLKSAIAAGCNDFITKPFSAEKFLEKIYKHASYVPFKVVDTSYESVDVDPMIENVKFEWNEDFELGLSEIDGEHMQIVENFEKLYRLMKEGRGHEYYLEIVEFLNDYVENHFAHEEIFQKSIGFNKIREHKLIHENFKQKVKDIIDLSKEKDINNMDLIKINLFIKDWLINHILIEDKKIADFVEINKEAMDI